MDCSAIRLSKPCVQREALHWMVRLSHSKDEEEAEDIQCLIDHTEILLDTLNGVNGEISKSKVIDALEQIKKRVEYMLADLRGEL